MCSGAQVVSQARETFPDIITTTATKTTSSGGRAALQTVTREMILFAPMFQLNYRPTDLASATASSQTTSALPSDTKSSATSSASSNTQPTSDPSSSNQSGLSTGAIAGIGVGAALGGIFLGAVAILLLLRHRRRRNAAAAEPPPQEPAQGQQHGGGAWTGVGGESGAYHNWKYAAQMPAHSQVGSELAADQDRYEVWGGTTPVELAAGPGNGLVGHAHNPNRG